MKLFTAMLFGVMCSSIAVYAQHTTSIPAKVTIAFAKEYTHVTNAQWDKEGQQYEASFKKDGHDISVVYSELPIAAKRYARTKGEIKDAAKITKADKSIQYEAEVNGKDLLFDDLGNLLQK